MKLISFFIVCAIVVGVRSLKQKPKIDIGECLPSDTMIDGSRYYNFFNDPENDDLKELLRYMRDIIYDYEDDETKIQNTVEKVLGTSEFSYPVTQMIIEKRKMNKDVSLCFIKKMIGDEEIRVFDHRDVKFQNMIRRLRARVKGLKFNVEEARAYVESFVGKNEMINQLSELFNTAVEMAKPYLITLLNALLPDKDTEKPFSFENVDFVKLLRNVRDLILNYKVDEDQVRDYLEEEFEIPGSDFLDLVSQLIKVKIDLDKHSLANAINRYIGDKEIQWDFVYHQTVFKKLLREFRDMIQDYIFEEDAIRAFVKIVFSLKSNSPHTREAVTRITQNIQILLEMLKQNINDFINRYLGEKEMPGAFFQAVDVKNLKLLRYRFQTQDFDAGNYVRDLLESSLKNNALADPMYNIWKLNSEQGRKTILEFIDKILEYREAEETESKQRADPYAYRLQRRLEKLISRMRYNFSLKYSRELLNENLLLIKKVNSRYEKLLLLGFDLNVKYKRMFETVLTALRHGLLKY